VIVVNDYFAGLLIEKFPDRKRLFLLQSIIVNLGILGFFKYYNFFIENLSGISGLLGWNYSLPFLNLI
jgi:alginate O-acetyltransferase complex protein AlgI